MSLPLQLGFGEQTSRVDSGSSEQLSTAESSTRSVCRAGGYVIRSLHTKALSSLLSLEDAGFHYALAQWVRCVEIHYGIPTRRTKSWKRRSECKLSNAGSTLRLIIRSSRSSRPFSNHSNAHSLSPTRTQVCATSTGGT